MSLLIALQLLLGAGAVYFVAMLCIDLFKNKNNLGKERSYSSICYWFYYRLPWIL